VAHIEKYSTYIAFWVHKVSDIQRGGDGHATPRSSYSRYLLSDLKSEDLDMSVTMLYKAHRMESPAL
jgi:hypothetical protein